MSEHSGSSGGGDRRRWRVVAAATAVGALGLLLGVPQFMAGLYLGPHDDTLRDIAAGRPVPDAVRARTAESREAALRWVASGGALSDLAVLRLTQVASTPVLSPARRGIVADAIALQRRALALSPADAYGWTRLVQARAIAAAPVRVIEPELRMAVARAPNASHLLDMRLNIALLYWRGLDEASRADTAGEVRRAALWSPELLARLARRRDLDAEIVRMLEGYPLRAARFAYARARVPELLR